MLETAEAASEDCPAKRAHVEIPRLQTPVDGEEALADVCELVIILYP